MIKDHYQMQGEGVCLLPYLSDFVVRYSQWMQDQQLLRLTASERLSVQEELKNCQEWARSPERFTFIIAQNQGETRLCGDVNVFMGQWVEPHQYQINIMIADRKFRGRGLARKALRMAMQFTSAFHGRTQCIAKIKGDNTASVNLFKSENFQVIDFSEQFGEWQLRKSVQRKTKEEVRTAYKLKEVKWE